jgi:hypothetical protein
MQRLENAPMVSRFHSLEQAVERRNQGWFYRVISCLYGMLSDYGSSVGRPLLWLLALFAVTFSAVLLSDGALINTSIDQKGWYSGLFGEHLLTHAERAFVLTASSTLNPLAIFATTGLLFPKYGLLTAWLPIHGLLSALCLVLLILALRRRFKIT